MAVMAAETVRSPGLESAAAGLSSPAMPTATATATGQEPLTESRSPPEPIAAKGVDLAPPISTTNVQNDIEHQIQTQYQNQNQKHERYPSDPFGDRHASASSPAREGVRGVVVNDYSTVDSGMIIPKAIETNRVENIPEHEGAEEEIGNGTENANANANANALRSTSDQVVPKTNTEKKKEKAFVVGAPSSASSSGYVRSHTSPLPKAHHVLDIVDLHSCGNYTILQHDVMTEEPDFLEESSPSPTQLVFPTSNNATTNEPTSPHPQAGSRSTYPPSPHAPPPPPAKNHPRSLAQYLSTHPHAKVAKAIRRSYPKSKNPVVRIVKRFTVKHDIIKGLGEVELKKWDEKYGAKAAEDAGWRRPGEPPLTSPSHAEPSTSTSTSQGRPNLADTRPECSELFWKIYLSILPTVQRHPLSGLCAPPLLGSTGTMPLTIVSLIPDIMKHYRDVIVRAEKEVFLVTNYWQPSNSVKTISGALRELSDIHMKRQATSGSGEPLKKIVVKLIYDRGSFEQLWNSHAPVKEDGWAALHIPLPDEIPGLSLEVINFHKVLLGTFHAKFLIVDRKVVLINSNNIQDRPNLELMTHLEGPIVDSFYEVALHSWYNKLEPMLPCIGEGYQPPHAGNSDSVGENENGGYLFRDANPYLQDLEVVQAAKEAQRRLRKETMDAQAAQGQPADRFRHVVRKAIDNAAFNVGERWDELFDSSGGDGAEEHRFRDWADKVRAPFASRPPSRRPSYDGADPRMTRRASAPVLGIRDEVSETPSSTTQVGNDDSREVTGWDRIRQVFPDLPIASKASQKPAQPANTGASRVEMKPAQLPEDNDHDRTRMSKVKIDEKAVEGKTTDTVSRPRSGSTRLTALTERFNQTGVLSEIGATVEDSDGIDTFQPHVLHKPHKPFPIALVNRKPQGMPGHHDIRNPQNAAWLAGCRYAKRKIFIQTPTLNARPIRRAIKQACRRGVEVILFLDLGFNDKGESIPFQGGTNEQVVERLYGILRPEGKDQYLKVYWYTGKDQIRPLNAVHKQRNCHIKFAVYDDEVAILGNGNQDTQSWMHSQETNILIDNKEVIAEIMATLYTNQNTQIYGLVGNDGIWRDADGNDIQKFDSTQKAKHQGLAGFIQFAKTI